MEGGGSNKGAIIFSNWGTDTTAYQHDFKKDLLLRRIFLILYLCFDVGSHHIVHCVFSEAQKVELYQIKHRRRRDPSMQRPPQS